MFRSAAKPRSSVPTDLLRKEEKRLKVAGGLGRAKPTGQMNRRIVDAPRDVRW